MRTRSIEVTCRTEAAEGQWPRRMCVEVRVQTKFQGIRSNTDTFYIRLETEAELEQFKREIAKIPWRLE